MQRNRDKPDMVNGCKNQNRFEWWKWNEKKEITHEIKANRQSKNAKMHDFIIQLYVCKCKCQDQENLSTFIVIMNFIHE